MLPTPKVIDKIDAGQYKSIVVKQIYLSLNILGCLDLTDYRPHQPPISLEK